jgi:DNA-binding response OmpR family regulator
MLLDIGLPGLDGHEVAKRIHRLTPLYRPLLIAMTEHDDWMDRRRTWDVGIHMRLVKPVAPDTIVGL